MALEQPRAQHEGKAPHLLWHPMRSRRPMKIQGSR